MRKPSVLTSFGRYADAALLTRAQFITTSMLASPSFPVPHLALDAAVTATDDFAAALLLAINGTRTDVSAKNQKKLALVKSLNALALYVMFVAQGDRTIMLESGFLVTSEPGGGSGVFNPEITELVNGPNPGELKAVIRGVAGARAYVYQIATTDPTLPGTEWESVTSTLTRHVFEGLESGRRYWVRVAAVGARQQLMYSAVLNSIVL